MGDLNAAVKPSNKYDGFYETALIYKGNKVFQSTASKTFYREGKSGGLEIMCTGEINEMFNEANISK